MFQWMGDALTANPNPAAPPEVQEPAVNRDRWNDNVNYNALFRVHDQLRTYADAISRYARVALNAPAAPPLCGTGQHAGGAEEQLGPGERRFWLDVSAAGLQSRYTVFLVEGGFNSTWEMSDGARDQGRGATFDDLLRENQQRVAGFLRVLGQQWRERRANVQWVNPQ